MKTILVMNGPNLNMLEHRENSHYGNLSLESINHQLLDAAERRGYFCEFFQSNYEGALIEKIHEAYCRGDFKGLIINPGAFAHYSIALRDALEILKIPVIEVHLSNIYKRDDFRKNMMTAPVTMGVISGLKHYGYLAALNTIIDVVESEGDPCVRTD